MTKSSRIVITTLGAAVLCGMTAGPARAADLTVRFAWYMPPHTATSDQAEAIARNIETMSKGAIKVQTYPAGSLAVETGMGQAITNNTVNMGIVGMHWWSNREAALDWDTIPFLVTEPAKLIPAFKGKLGDDINAILNRHNVEVVGWGFYGYSISYVNTKREVKVPADLDGLKIRSDGKLNNVFLRDQGAVPVAIDSSEVYTALQRGTLDGASSGMASFVSRKWIEVGKYITAIKYSPIVYPIQANASWWKGLTQEQRDIIAKAIADTEESNLKTIEKDFTGNIEVAEKAGVKVYRPTDAELRIWKEKAYPHAVETYLKAAGPEGRKMLDDVQSAMN